MEEFKYIFIIATLYPFILNSQQTFVINCPVNCNCNFSQETVNCSYANIENLPSSIHNETKHLDLSHNEIQIVPLKIKTFIFLKKLSLAYNSIWKLTPDCFFGLNELESLDLSYNNFESWFYLFPSKTFAHLRSLKILDLSGNNLHEIFFEKSNHLISTSLSELHLKENNISVTDNKNAFSNLTSLETLIISNNLFKNFFGFYSESLQTLDISNCTIKSISPDAFTSMPNLLNLNASNNINLKSTKQKPRSTSVKKIAFENCSINIKYLSEFPNVTHMYLSGNKLHYLEDDCFLNNLHAHFIDISNTDLTLISRLAFRNLIDLNELNLSTNQIRMLDPSVFSTNNQLTNLDLSRNYFTKIVEIYSKSLSKLDMSTCEIKLIKSGVLLKLPALKELNLAYNWISLLPHSFKSLSLETLDLSNCRLKYISNSSFKSLESLIKLKLNDNFFTDEFSSHLFPRSIETIELYNNLWHCNCLSREFKQFYDYLTKSPAKSDAKRLICYTPKEKRDFSWTKACHEEWSARPISPNKWMLMLVMFITIITLFCIILFAKKIINEQYERHRHNEDEVSRLDGLERLRRIREQARANAQLNAPDPRETQSPPTYEEALLMQRPNQQSNQNANTPKNNNLRSVESSNTNNAESNDSIKSESDVTEDQDDSVSNRNINNTNNDTPPQTNYTSLQEHHF